MSRLKVVFLTWAGWRITCLNRSNWIEYPSSYTSLEIEFMLKKCQTSRYTVCTVIFQSFSDFVIRLIGHFYSNRIEISILSHLVTIFVQHRLHFVSVLHVRIAWWSSAKLDAWRHVLHWLDVTDRIRFRLCIQVYKCQHIMTAGYLVDLCRPVSSINSHKHLRSANCGQRQVPVDRCVNLWKPCFWTCWSIYLECSSEHS